MYHLALGVPLKEAQARAEQAEIAELRAQHGDYDVEATTVAIAECNRLTDWYVEWQPKHNLVTVDAEIEGEFTIPGLDEPYTYRIDAVVRDERGRLWARDFKSTKKTFPVLFRNYGMDYQMMGYTLGGRQKYPDLRGVIITAVRKLKRVTSPNELFQDEPFQYSQTQLEEFKVNRALVASTIARKDPTNREEWRKNPDQCYSINGKCPYYDLCRYPETEEQTLAAYFVRAEGADKEEEPSDAEP